MRYTARLLSVILLTAFAFALGVLEAEDGIVAEEHFDQKPVAMVQVRHGLFPVSRTGILLPADEVTSEDAGQYIQIDIGKRDPIGPVGTKYGYRAVTEAARIAVFVSDIWRDARLKAIAVAGPGTETPHEYVLEPNRHGVKVLWGHAPGSEETGEAKAPAKLKRLTRFVRENSPEYTFLPTPSTVLDLRPAKGPLITSDAN